MTGLINRNQRSLHINDQQRKLIFLTVLLLALVTLLFCSHIASVQNQQYVQQYKTVQQMSELARQQQYQQVISLYEQLKPGFADSYQAIAIAAYAYKQENNYERAEILCKDAMKVRPSLENEPSFLALYGDILYLNKKSDEARVVLERSLQCSPSEKTSEEIKILLNKITANGNY